MTRERFNLEATIQMLREQREVYRKAGFYRDVEECDRRIERREKELALLKWREALAQAAKGRRG